MPPAPHDADSLLEGLDPSQREAVTSDARPLAIHAGAGSGKTRVLTHRIAWQSATGAISPGRVLALTFTRKAAGELRERISRLGVLNSDRDETRDQAPHRDHPTLTAGTFHAVALVQLRRYHADRNTPMPAVLGSKARILAPMLGKRDSSQLRVIDVASEIEWAKARLVSPPRYLEAVSASGRVVSQAERIAGLYERYEQEKNRRLLVDFDDLLLECAKAIENDRKSDKEGKFAAAQRWRFRHLFVDEFQDINRSQFRLLRAWLGIQASTVRGESGAQPDLCVVGDPDQAIYGFAGAEPRYLEEFEKVFPGSTTVRLRYNYRSTPQVVATSRSVLPASRSRLSVETTKQDGPAPTIAEYSDEHAEAGAVIAAAVTAHSFERPWHSMAVLYRTNAQSLAFEEACKKSKVPYRVRGAGAFLGRAEVKDLVAGIRSSAAAQPSLSFKAHLVDLQADATEAPEEVREHAAALASLGHEYLAAEGEVGSVDGFLGFLNTALRNDEVSGGDAIDLLTFHSAKGLEWETVWVTGLEKGLVPISHAEGKAAALAEESRLLYVALSRSRRWLHCTHAEKRNFGERTSFRTRSALLDLIESVTTGISLEELSETGGDVNRRGASRAQASLSAIALGDLAVEDRPLFEELKAWRLSTSRAASIPAFTVFDNKTLTAIATHRPSNLTQLLSVSGVGPVKAERYGEAILEIIARHNVEISLDIDETDEPETAN
ncbi:HRDC domain-containing protein [Actinobacteria bacterium IMCC26256]|nr:HRDC domain-containing protein [Actinobacteria bacterium IMCC26256]